MMRTGSVKKESTDERDSNDRNSVLLERALDLFGREARKIVLDEQFVTGRLDAHGKEPVDRMHARDSLQVIARKRTRKLQGGLHFRHRESE